MFLFSLIISILLLSTIFLSSQAERAYPFFVRVFYSFRIHFSLACVSFYAHLKLHPLISFNPSNFTILPLLYFLHIFLKSNNLTFNFISLKSNNLTFNFISTLFLFSNYFQSISLLITN